MESLGKYLVFENKNKMVDKSPWKQWITDSYNFKSVNSTLMVQIIWKIVIILCLSLSKTNVQQNYLKINLRLTSLRPIKHSP